MSHYLTTPFPWTRYSKKLLDRISDPHNVGGWNRDAPPAGMQILCGTAGTREDGNSITISLLVDSGTGSVVDAKFRCFGQTALIGAADAACDLLVGKHVQGVKRIDLLAIDKRLRDPGSLAAFPPETIPHAALVVAAINAAAAQAAMFPTTRETSATKVQDTVTGFPGFKELPAEHQRSVVEGVLDEEVRPFIALDGGGVTVLDVKDGCRVAIAYHGNCTSCFSAMGSTLGYIQQILRRQISPDIEVVPEW